MGAATVVTLLGVALIAAALAAYLTTIALTLKNVSFTLGTILIGVRAIAGASEPLEELVGGIAREIRAIDDAVAGVAKPAGRTPPRARAGR